MILLQTQEGDWEGLYIEGKLYQEGHTIGEGNAEKFWLELGQARQYDDLVIATLNDKDNDNVTDYGNFPENLSDLCGVYDHENYSDKTSRAT